ncbi:hypothetical protein [Cellvibrio sp. UBA7661]|uniref:hypothetical protein n=1 Tax=Cellvibrio sp. UBA7661 TaxID=1946311 RepID=UPI002F35D78F
MKFLPLLFFIAMSSPTYASSKCSIKSKDLNFITPKANNIANTYWQDSNENGESVKRLHITYKDGSTAVIKHTFCSEYKFEAVYYTEEQEQTNSTDKIKASFTTFLSYVAHKDNMQKKAIKSMMAELDKYTFVPDEAFGATYNGHESVYGDTSYSVLYSPLNYSAIYSAAISVEVGIGGIH